MGDPGEDNCRVSPDLPALATPSFAQLCASGVWLAAASLLLVTVAVRTIQELDGPHWWIPVAILTGMAAADFASGFVHWAADTWGRADLPVIGARVLLPFRVHHLNPDDMLRRSFLDANGDVAAVTIPVLAVLSMIPADGEGWQFLLTAGVGCCGVGMLTNQIHQWAHHPSPPAGVRVLQRWRLVLRRDDHAQHHADPYHVHYCITTGWCNGPLEAIGFFRVLERIITCLTGLVPRADEAVR